MLSKTYSWLRLVGIGLAILFSLTGTALAQTHIFVDPGHGGVWPDGKPGCETYIPGFYESTINLGVGLDLQEFLIYDVPTYTSEFSRLSDVGLTVEQRVYLANVSDASTFLSVPHLSEAAGGFFGVTPVAHSLLWETP